MIPVLEKLKKNELCPSILNMYLESYSFSSCMNDILAGIKMFLLIFPIITAISIFDGNSPTNGILSCIIAIIITALIGGSKYQINTVAVPLTILTLEITMKYQYKGLLVSAIIAGLTLYLFGRMHISSVLRYSSTAFLSALVVGAAIIIAISQLQYILGISSPPPYHNIVEITQSLSQGIRHVSIFNIYSALGFIGSLLVLKMLLRGYTAYIVYLVLCIAIFSGYSLDLINLPKEFSLFKTIGRDFFEGMENNSLLSTSLSLPSTSMLGSLANYGFAIAIFLSIQVSFCTNISASLSGDHRVQTNMEMIATGVSNILSIATGGVFVMPDIQLSVKNIQYKVKTILPMCIIAALLQLTLVFKNYIFPFIPMYAVSAVLIILSLSIILKSRIVDHLLLRTSDWYIFIVTISAALYIGYVPAIFIGFILSLLHFSNRIVQIKNTSVHTTKNHDKAAVEFVANKYGYLKTKDIPNKTMKKIEILQINNILFLNLVDLAREGFASRGTFPSAIILFFKNVPFLDEDAFTMMKEFVSECINKKCIVVVSGTNGILMDILQRKTKECNSGNIFGYIVPTFSHAVDQIIKRLR